jgi:hypothetical protein
LLKHFVELLVVVFEIVHCYKIKRGLIKGFTKKYPCVGAERRFQFIAQWISGGRYLRIAPDPKLKPLIIKAQPNLLETEVVLLKIEIGTEREL